MTSHRLAPWLLLLPLVANAAAPSLKEVDRIHLGGAARWDYLAIDSAAHRLYVSHATQTEVIDTTTDKLVGTIPDTVGVHGIAIAADLGLGFISDGKADQVTVFELSTLQVKSTIAVGANPDAIFYDAATRRLMTFNGKSQDVTVIDAAQGTVVATVPAGGKPEFAQAGAGGTAWFNVEDKNEMAVLDPAQAKVVKRVPLAPCDSPSGLAVDGRQRHYAVCENKQMAIVSADGAAWSANGQDGTISVVSETAPGRFATVATIPTAAGARTIAADPATHRLYLPTAELAPAVKGERRAGVPDTFYLLVLAKR